MKQWARFHVQDQAGNRLGLSLAGIVPSGVMTGGILAAIFQTSEVFLSRTHSTLDDDDHMVKRDAVP